MDKLKKEISIIIFSACVTFVPYIVTALIISVFSEGPTYGHTVPLSVAAFSFLLVWFIAHLDMR